MGKTNKISPHWFPKGFFCNSQYYQAFTLPLLIMHVRYRFGNQYFPINNQNILDKGSVARRGIRAKKDGATQTLFTHEQLQTSPALC